MPYFTDREQAPRPRTSEEITLPVAKGLAGLIRARSVDGSFGFSYPETCWEYSSATVGTNQAMLEDAVAGYFPGIDWPLNAEQLAGNLTVLDLLEFTFEKIARPLAGQSWSSHESYANHRHLSFDPDAGRESFRVDVNQLLSRNGLAFNLEPNGQIIRLAPPVLGDALAIAVFHTGDAELDTLLETARTKFSSHSPAVRQEGLEKLWDAFERTKTLEPGDKKASVTALLAKAIPEPNLRARVNAELNELTSIGNNFMIRHTEVGKTPINDPLQVDFLFHRAFAAVQLLLRATGRM